MDKLYIKTYSLPPVDEREALRYTGVRGEADEGTISLLSSCIEECANALSPKVCFRRLTKETLFSVLAGAKESAGLRAALAESEEVFLFAATLGLGLDRLFVRYAKLSPARALLLQAIGAERIEALCDEFCKEQGAQGRRFSAGYGDFPLAAQKDIIRLLDCPKAIGVTLTDGLLMSPTKSVTAIVGANGACEEKDYAQCEKKDCEYRK